MNREGSLRPVRPVLRRLLKLGSDTLLRRLRHNQAKNGGDGREDGGVPRGMPGSKGRLRYLVRHVSDVVTVFEADGTPRYASPSLERVLGQDPEHVVGGVHLWLLHPDANGRVVEALTGVWASPGVNPPVEEVRLRHADGSWRFMEAIGNGLLDDPGGVVLRDVTERRQAEETLGESRARFRAVFEDSAIGMALMDRDGRPEESNLALQRILGYTAEELSGLTFDGLTHPEDTPADKELYGQLMAGERDYYQMEKRYVRKDGRLLWGRTTVSLVRGVGGEPRFAVGMVEDVTDRRLYEEELRRSQERLSSVQRIAHIGNWECYVGEDEAYWSEETYHIFGLDPREEGLVPTYRTFLRLVHPDDRSHIRRAAREVPYPGNRPSLDYRIVRPDGEIRHIHTRYEVLHETGRPARLVGTVHDITERKTLEERLQHQAFHDPLTGLPNRALFMDRLGHALARVERRGRRVAVLFLDLDDFKRVNDSLGHEVGDKLLVEVAGRLLACVRPEDTVARMGGDEFTILLEDADGADGAARVAGRISEALRAPFVLAGHELFASASIGVFPGGAGGEGPEDLLRGADLALYRAKDKGKARYEVFEEAM